MYSSLPSSPSRSGAVRRPSSRSGAALIVALAVLLVLLSIAITFALIVRLESDMAAQVYEGARADNLLDGALALAMHRLNADLEVHPDALSLDHSWRSWFSGSAFVEKTWTRETQGEKAGTGLGQQGLVSAHVQGGAIQIPRDFLKFRNRGAYARFPMAIPIPIAIPHGVIYLRAMD